MNNLIIEILPLIELTARKLTGRKDDQNELVQSVVLKCYEYSETVKRLHSEGKVGRWVYVVMRNDLLKMKMQEPIEIYSEIEDIVYSDKLEELKPLLTEIERMWIRAYIECDGSYTQIEIKKNISRQHASERIKSIIEKCKQLKRIL